MAGKRHDLSEIEIAGEKDSFLGRRLDDDSRVIEAMQPLVAEVNGVVALVAQPRRHVRRYAHIE